MDLPTLWEQIRSDLMRARRTLPSDAGEQKGLPEYEEFLNHNELELACDMLEFYAEENSVGAEFWIALRDAAEKMGLSDRVRKYEEFARTLGGR